MSIVLHKNFISWAKENGINLDYADDYVDWNNCWLKGYENGMKEDSYEPWIELGTEPEGGK